MAGKLPTGVDPEIETRFEEINRQFQRVTMTFFTRAPLAKEIRSVHWSLPEYRA